MPRPKSYADLGSKKNLVQYANSLASHGQIKSQLWPINNPPAGGHLTSTDIALELGDVESVPGERKHAIAALQTNRRINGSEARVYYANLPLYIWIGPAARGVG